MNKKYTTSLFIFRRDLRVQDNTGLLAALAQSESVIPCFIFDPRQVEESNRYRSTNLLQFMGECLHDLDAQLEQFGGKLYLLYGTAEEVIEELLKKEKIDAVFTNRDYTPFSIKRDEKIAKACTRADVAWHQLDDLLLNRPEDVLSLSNTPYTKFTPYFNRASQNPVPKPHIIKVAHFYTKKITGAHTTAFIKEVLPYHNPNLHVHGGRTESSKILRSIEDFGEYATTRNLPILPSTNLAAYIKFGTHSIREIFHTITQHLGAHHPLLQQLYWHDFFTQSSFHSPFVFGRPFQAQYEYLPWKNSKKDFENWCNGTTGFPIVDAGMRQLNTTGFMHNRVRMIVASFLVKDLHIDWRWGEQYFARQLIDYDPCVNNGNWQWSASTGYDAQPYFRIFNPWLQQAKFDPDCTYIKTWVPELKRIDAKTLHTWYKEVHPTIKNYPRPMVDHSEESELAKEMFKRAAGGN